MEVGHVGEPCEDIRVMHHHIKPGGAYGCSDGRKCSRSGTIKQREVEHERINMPATYKNLQWSRESHIEKWMARNNRWTVLLPGHSRRAWDVRRWKDRTARSQRSRDNHRRSRLCILVYVSVHKCPGHTRSTFYRADEGGRARTAERMVQQRHNRRRECEIWRYAILKSLS